MATPASGTLIGAYQIEGVIGAGSMGDVFRGIDVGLSRKVAIKILSEKHKDSNELRARFTREGRAVAAIAHPNVVQVFATGVYEDRPYIAMELLEGTDLASLIDDDGPMSSVVAARAILDAARGLDAAAKAGLIHRDVKPSNLVRLLDGRVKVTDFGLAKPVDPGSEPALTALGVVVGTPDYIAPEQARGETIDERVDIYALGGTLYFLLTGLPPFRTGNPAEDKYLKVVARHLKNPPPDPRERAPGVAPELAELVRAMMAKKPAERPDYPTMIARLEALIADLQDGRAVTAPPIASPAGPRLDTGTPFVGADAPPAFEDDGGSTRAAIAAVGAQGLPKWVWAATALAVIVFAGGLVHFLGRGAAAPTEPGGGTGAAEIDAGVAEATDAPPPPPLPTAPEGMVLVTRPDGTPWLFVDARPVTAAEWAKGFPKLKAPKAKALTLPVVNAPYNFAKAYAQTVGKRLLTDEEWQAAVITPGVIASPSQYEWIAPAVGKQAPVRAPGKQAMKPLAGGADITVRLGRDL
ncbi:MAG: protein kinase [Myxococcales bacterium]|nr:protein kinase [Myxococcales bacterium]